MCLHGCQKATELQSVTAVLHHSECAIWFMPTVAAECVAFIADWVLECPQCRQAIHIVCWGPDRIFTTLSEMHYFANEAVVVVTLYVIPLTSVLLRKMDAVLITFCVTWLPCHPISERHAIRCVFPVTVSTWANTSASCPNIHSMVMVHVTYSLCVICKQSA